MNIINEILQVKQQALIKKNKIQSYNAAEFEKGQEFAEKMFLEWFKRAVHDGDKSIFPGNFSTKITISDSASRNFKDGVEKKCKELGKKYDIDAFLKFEDNTNIICFCI